MVIDTPAFHRMEYIYGVIINEIVKDFKRVAVAKEPGFCREKNDKCHIKGLWEEGNREEGGIIYLRR